MIVRSFKVKTHCLGSVESNWPDQMHRTLSTTDSGHIMTLPFVLNDGIFSIWPLLVLSYHVHNIHLNLAICNSSKIGDLSMKY